MKERIFRLHINGRTILSWFIAIGDQPMIPLFNTPRDEIKIRFGYTEKEMSEVEINGYLAFRFWEVRQLPANSFAVIEFLMDNNLWRIEYRPVIAAPTQEELINTRSLLDGYFNEEIADPRA